MVEGSWPAINALGFLPILAVQATLLHPIFPPHLARPLRFLFAFPTCYFAFFAPIHYGFQPARDSALYNFILSVMNLYACWKSVEFGLASEEGLLAYTWIGFEEEKEVLLKENVVGKEKKVIKNGVEAKKNVNGVGTYEKKTTPPSTRGVLEKSNLRRLRALSAANDGPLDIFIWTLHLLMSMRGIGWAFGPSPYNVAKPYPSKPLYFFLYTFSSLIATHVVLLLCAYNLTTLSFHKVMFYYDYLPFLTPTQVYLFSETLTGLSLGTGAYAGLQAGYLTAIILVFLPQTLLHALFSKSIPRFDPRQYPPIFQNPWYFTSVRRFWGVQWHSFFAQSFKTLGYNPVVAIFGEGVVGKALGVLAVFAMSAWLHEHAIWVSTSPINLPEQPTLILKWGGTLYFLAQGVGIILETLFTSITGRKVSGFLGQVWSFPIIAGLGAWVYLSWSSQGILYSIPEMSHWTWERWVFPIACFAPKWLWSN